jgi:hypothetical protein
MHWRQRIGTWSDQPRSKGHDQHKHRAHLRRQQRQAEQQKRAALLAQLRNQI